MLCVCVYILVSLDTLKRSPNGQKQPKNLNPPVNQELHKKTSLNNLFLAITALCRSVFSLKILQDYIPSKA